MHVDVNGARLWVEEEGVGPAVLFLHGGLGDSRLWAPVTALLADELRCIRYDLRFYGRSEGPDEEWSPADDAAGVLDALGVAQAPLVGLSLGGRVALETALLHPERVTAVVHVAGAVAPVELDPEIEAAYEAARTPEQEMLVDFRVWAPLGVDDTIRSLWAATPEARGVDRRPTRPEGTFDDVAAPIYVVTAAHDPAPFRAAAARLPAVQAVEVDSDHYLTLREPARVAAILRDFLRPRASSRPGARTATR